MSGKMVVILKEYEAVVDYCAFMVAIVLVRHVVDSSNHRCQWSAEELSESLNLLPYAKSANFYVHSLGLKHGMHIFSRCLTSKGHTIVLMKSANKVRTKYFTLEAFLSSHEIIFQSLHNPSTSDSEEILMSNILLTRRELLRAARYQESNDLCASSVFGGLYHSLILDMESNLEKCANDSVAPCKKTKITRKSPIDLLPRAINNNTIKLLEDVDLKFGKEDALFYLESATKKCKKRSIDEMDQDEDDDNDADDDDDDEISNETEMEREMLTADIMEDDRIISVLTENSDKYIVFSSEDRKYAITVY